MKLYTYYRSSAAYRVRIALNLKDIEHDLVFVNLLEKQHQSNDYLAKNKQGLVPIMELSDGSILTQSSAMLDYLDAEYSNYPLFSDDNLLRAQMLEFINIIACDIHPLNNLRVLNYIKNECGQSPEMTTQWYHHWLKLGFAAAEEKVQGHRTVFGDKVSIAECYLIPQIYNALRFKLDMTPYPKLMSIYEHCNSLQAFIDAQPENQADCNL